jgi:glutamate racemase
MPDSRPIGVFDSGVGGLTVARALMDLLPDERILYVGDTARGPYGPRDLREVRRFTGEIFDWLRSQGVKLAVAACNTATAAALEPGRDPIDVAVPTVGVITPAVRAAVAATRTGRIGVIGTVGTIASGSYARAVAEVAPGVELVGQACPRFVSYVEAGRTTDPDVLRVAREYLAPLQQAGVDTLILGCTHYPLLTGVLGHVMGPEVVLVSSAEATARAVFSQLVDEDLLAPGGRRPPNRYVATGDGSEFARLAARFLGPRIAAVELEAIAPDDAAARTA